MSHFTTQENRAGWLFAMPFATSLFLFFLYAAIKTFFFSLTDYDLFSIPHFIGLSNYLKLFSDDLFLVALRNTLGFSLITTTAQTTVALILAVAVNNVIVGRGIARTVLYIPGLMSSAAMTIIFLWFFQRDGILTALLRSTYNYRWYILLFVVGVSVVQSVLVLLARRIYYGVTTTDPYFLLTSIIVTAISTSIAEVYGVFPISQETFLISWLNTQQTFLFIPQPLWSVALMNIFTTVPGLALLFVGGLQSVPQSLYEAARIDGASAVQCFIHITVPELRPILFAVVTLGIIGTLQMFDQVVLMGDAAPLRSIITLAYYVYDNNFPGGASARVGLASAAAMLLGALTIGIVCLQRLVGVTDGAKS